MPPPGLSPILGDGAWGLKFFNQSMETMHKLLFVAVLLPSMVWAADMNGDRRIDRKDGRILHEHFLGLNTNQEAQEWARDPRSDLNLDGTVNEQDALIMFYTYSFLGVMDKSEVMRRNLLSALRGALQDTDTSYQQLIRNARVFEEDLPVGSLVLPGVVSIPRRGSLSNSRVAAMVAITEYGRVNSEHYREVRGVGCESFFRPCNLQSLPFTILGTTFFFGTHITNDFLSRLPDTTKLISVSIKPGGKGFPEVRAADLPFSVVQGAGNDNHAYFFESYTYDSKYVLSDNEVRVTYNLANDRFESEDGLRAFWSSDNSFKNILAAVEADKVLYVAGHDVDSNGQYQRGDGSTGCGDLNNGCLYAPMAFDYGRHGVAGTSFSTPNVAIALASVLAVFPDLSGIELVKLAKACAKPVDTIPDGIGIADFTCMTKEEGGRRRLITRAELNALITPEAMKKVYESANRVRPAAVRAVAADEAVHKKAVKAPTTFIPMPAFDETGRRIDP